MLYITGREITFKNLILKPISLSRPVYRQYGFLPIRLAVPYTVIWRKSDEFAHFNILSYAARSDSLPLARILYVCLMFFLMTRLICSGFMFSKYKRNSACL